MVLLIRFPYHMAISLGIYPTFSDKPNSRSLWHGGWIAEMRKPKGFLKRTPSGNPFFGNWSQSPKKYHPKIEGFLNWDPKSWMVYKGNSQSTMDDLELPLWPNGNLQIISSPMNFPASDVTYPMFHWKVYCIDIVYVQGVQYIYIYIYVCTIHMYMYIHIHIHIYIYIHRKW